MLTLCKGYQLPSFQRLVNDQMMRANHLITFAMDFAAELVVLWLLLLLLCVGVCFSVHVKFTTMAFGLPATIGGPRCQCA